MELQNLDMLGERFLDSVSESSLVLLSLRVAFGLVGLSSHSHVLVSIKYLSRQLQYAKRKKK